MVKPIKYSGFPKACTDAMGVADRCKSIYAKVVKQKYIDQEGKEFTPEFSSYPSKVTYSGYQIPRGDILGVKYSFRKGEKMPITFLDQEGNVRKLPLKKDKMEALVEVIKGLHINHEMLFTEGADASSVVLWFVVGGGYKEEERVTGTDYMDSFLILIAVKKDGKWLPFSKFKSSESKALALRKSRIFYINDFTPINNLDPKDPQRMAGVVKNYLEKDEIRDTVLKIRYTTAETAYAALLVPDYPLFFNRPECWAVIKYQQ